MTLKLCSIAAAMALAFGLTAAQAQQTRDPAPRADSTTGKVKEAVREHKVKDAEEDRIEAEYKAAKAKCDQMKDRNEKEVCEADAKGKEKVAKAEHTYHVAKEKCDMQKGKDEKACEKQVKAEYDKAKADIKKQFAERKDERPRSASSGVTK